MYYQILKCGYIGVIVKIRTWLTLDRTDSNHVIVYYIK